MQHARAWGSHCLHKCVFLPRAEGAHATTPLLILSHHKIDPMQDGVPRGAYKGVVTLRNAHGALLFVAPAPVASGAAAQAAAAGAGGQAAQQQAQQQR